MIISCTPFHMAVHCYYYYHHYIYYYYYHSYKLFGPLPSRSANPWNRLASQRQQQFTRQQPICSSNPIRAHLIWIVFDESKPSWIQRLESRRLFYPHRTGPMSAFEENNECQSSLFVSALSESTFNLSIYYLNLSAYANRKRYSSRGSVSSIASLLRYGNPSVSGNISFYRIHYHLERIAFSLVLLFVFLHTDRRIDRQGYTTWSPERFESYCTIHLIVIVFYHFHWVFFSLDLTVFRKTKSSPDDVLQWIFPRAMTSL